MLASFRRRHIPSKVPPRYRQPSWRKIGLLRARGRRVRHRAARHLMLFSGWVWFAAASLVGFEMFDMIFGTFLLAPELLPVVLIGLAFAWYFREALRRTKGSIRVRLRLARMRRSTQPERSVHHRS
ncbi:hypothetical protein [Curtobacterium sp. MCBD17_019]|uniref:hypothetical protein n=1 Tax=Curtobacterium sp. MCBD17_019 TaxID=2175669 RepID=UPI000DA7AD81|nr:hypothetical protein [Curtobacterium sp. MCBD17_019]PZE77831.1 hypothetical protein DEI82_03275 [Curtobacterium sp. MCBD17_019]